MSAQISEALIAANVEYVGLSWNGFSLFGDRKSIDEAMRMQNETANTNAFRDEIKHLRDDGRRLHDVLRVIADMEPGTQEWVDGTVSPERAMELLGSIFLIVRAALTPTNNTP